MLDQLVREVRAQPTLYRAFDSPARRHFRGPFPYAVIYVDRPDHVWIVAVAPFKMWPGYWKTDSADSPPDTLGRR